MRVLTLHSSYLSGSTSGENRVVDDEVRLLREGGHEVHVWAPSPEAVGIGRLVHAGIDTVWSRSAVGELKSLLKAFRPQVVHCHNLFPVLSPAVLRAASAAGQTVVMTLHNYRLICLPATLFREGVICEACLGHVPWRGVAYRCYRNSGLGSGALAASLTVHRTIRTFDRVDLYLAISRFVRDKHVQAGLPAGRIAVKPNFAWEGARRESPGEYFLYVGRLAAEKGVDALLQAWTRIDARLLIVGEGPEETRLKAIAPSSVEFRPSVSPSEVQTLLSHARALMVPSVWYEGAGKVVLEAYAAGVPVVANRIGALPEVIEDGSSGLLLPSHDPEAWEKAAFALLDDSLAERMGNAAQMLWQERYRPSIALAALQDAYEQAAELSHRAPPP